MEKLNYEEPKLFLIDLLDESAKGWSEPQPPPGAGGTKEGDNSKGASSEGEPFKFAQ